MKNEINQEKTKHKITTSRTCKSIQKMINQSKEKTQVKNTQKENN